MLDEQSTPDPWSPPYVSGDVVAGKYRVEHLLGSGGMAWVFQATHLMLQKRVALKFMRVDPDADNTEALTRFRREARAAASIAGEATARVMDVGTLDDGSPFLVMECLEGHDLDSVVERRTRLPVETAVEYAVQACEGLAETHAAGIVHRDLKPANLFLTHSSDGALRIKLLDFGVSKFAAGGGFRGAASGEAKGSVQDRDSVTSTQALIGSPVYMSPEQMRSSRGVDSRTDIWSMGVILYELLAMGRSPFAAATLPEICARVLDGKPAPLSSIRPDLPRGLEAVVLRCLAKDPARRFQTVAELAAALVPFGPPDARARADRMRRILGGNDERARFTGREWREWSVWRRRLRAGGVVAACASVVVAATLGLRQPEVKAEGNPARSGLTRATTIREVLAPLETPAMSPVESPAEPDLAGSTLATTTITPEPAPDLRPPPPRTETPPDPGALARSNRAVPAFPIAAASPGASTAGRIATRSTFDIAEFGGRE
jgi:tRNA A-37 threonylcarbamoyl transferase component Bud32